MEETAATLPRPATKGWLAAEFLALFFGVVGVYALAGSPGSTNARTPRPPTSRPSST